MASKTTNYNLHKIDLTDAPPDITVLNPNFDIIDTELKNLNDGKAEAVHTHDYLPSSGGTVTGNLVVKGSMQGAVKNYYTDRQTSANLPVVGDGTVKHFLATSNMTTGKPIYDGYITHYEWDNAFSTCSSQVYVPNNTTSKNRPIQYRTLGGGAWSNWHSVYSTDFKPTPSEIGAAASSHTHDDRYYTESEIDTKITELESKVSDCFQSVSDGKTKVANAITDKGVATKATDSFATMASNISAIQVGIDTSTCTATPDKILKGETAGVKGEVVTGTMPNKSNTTVSWCGYEAVSVQTHPSDASQALITVPNAYGQVGYYNAGSAVGANVANLNPSNIRAGVKVGRNDGSAANCITGTFTADATADASKILSGYNAGVNGQMVTGTMANQSAYTGSLSTAKGGESFYVRIPHGAYLTNGGSGYPEVTVHQSSIASAAGVAASQIVSGESVLGITGNGGVKYATGSTFTIGQYAYESMIVYRNNGSIASYSAYSNNTIIVTTALGWQPSVLQLKITTTSGIFYAVIPRNSYSATFNQEGYTGFRVAHFQNYSSTTTQPVMNVGDTFYMPWVASNYGTVQSVVWTAYA